jgi:hypothetical protein
MPEPLKACRACSVKIRPVRTISRKLPTGRILRDCTPSPLFGAVKIQSDPHGDMGSEAEMTPPTRLQTATA